MADPEKPSEPAALPAWTPPIDPGDAGGRHNGVERTVAPGTLHQTAEETRAETIRQGFDVPTP